MCGGFLFRQRFVFCMCYFVKPCVCTVSEGLSLLGSGEVIQSDDCYRMT